MQLRIGEIYASKYRIVRLLGEGGMGAVYEGENVRIHRRVALKTLHPSVASRKDTILRFEREAQAAGRIGSQHIVEVLDLGDLEDGTRYLVMEFLDGTTLDKRIRSRGKLSPEEASALVVQLLEGLAAAHQASIIHRDLKPANVLLTTLHGQTDFVKILDFGVSKFNLLSDEMSMTSTGAVLGTPYYMSPEQAKGSREIDARSDLYAVGVILYECITGQVPFSAETFNELIFRIALESPPPVESFVPYLDQGFIALIHKAMAREPHDRFQTAAEFSAALRGWLAHSAEGARPLAGGGTMIMSGPQPSPGSQPTGQPFAPGAMGPQASAPSRPFVPASPPPMRGPGGTLPLDSPPMPGAYPPGPPGPHGIATQPLPAVGYPPPPGAPPGYGVAPAYGSPLQGGYDAGSAAPHEGGANGAGWPGAGAAEAPVALPMTGRGAGVAVAAFAAVLFAAAVTLGALRWRRATTAAEAPTTGVAASSPAAVAPSSAASPPGSTAVASAAPPSSVEPAPSGPPSSVEPASPTSPVSPAAPLAAAPAPATPSAAVAPQGHVPGSGPPLRAGGPVTPPVGRPRPPAAAPPGAPSAATGRRTISTDL